MKQLSIIFLLIISFQIQADVPVIPQVFNFGSSVQVQVHNRNSYPVTCSGTVNMQTVNGRSPIEFYQAYIIAGGTNWRTFNNRDFSDHIFNVFHTISCVRVN